MTDITTLIIVVGIIISAISALWLKSREGESALPEALNKIADMALRLILEAERAYGAGTGIFKKSYVVEAILNSPFFGSLPTVVKRLVTAETLGKVIDTVCVETFKKQQESNKNLTRLIDADN